MWSSPTGAPSSRRPGSMSQKKALLDAVDAAVKSEAWKKTLAAKNWTDLYLRGRRFRQADQPRRMPASRRS